MFKEYPDIMTIPQVAEALKIGRKAAYALVNGNLLGHIRIGRNIKVPRKCLWSSSRRPVTTSSCNGQL